MIGGCMNFTAINFISEATYDSGDCIIEGCMFDIFPNYNPLATVDNNFSCDMNQFQPREV